MTTLLDTSVLVGTASASGIAIADGWATSVISIGELEAGVLVAADPDVRAARLRRLTAVLAAAPVIAVDHAVAARYGELRAASGRGPCNDLWIAATALAHDMTLLTADRRQALLPLVRVVLAGR